MTVMSKNDFFLYSLATKLIYKLDWWKGVFAFPVKNRLIKIENGKYKYGDIEIDAPLDNPIFDIEDIVEIPENTLAIRKEKFKDTVGRILVNIILIEYGLKGLIGYQSKMFSYKGDLEKIVLDGINASKIDMADIKRLYKIFTFFRNVSKFITIPVTEDTFYPPDWLDDYKKSLQKEYEKKYVKDWMNNDKLVIEYEDTIMKRVKEYYKDDPTFGITMDKKTLGAFKKKYVSIGITETLDKNNKPKAILTSLSEGIPDNKEDIAAIMNSVIYGVSGRALGTQNAGVVAKRLLAAVQSFTVEEDDCGTTDGLPIKITDKNIEALKVLYRVEGAKTYLNDEDFLKSSIGKTIMIRVPAYCKLKGDNLCKKCTGINVARFRNGLILLAASVAGAYLNYQLSKFHGSTYNLKTFDIDDL